MAVIVTERGAYRSWKLNRADLIGAEKVPDVPAVPGIVPAAIFGRLASLLASIGIFGVIVYGDQRDRHPSSIGSPAPACRLAGASRTLSMAAVGLAIAVPAVLALSPVLNDLLQPGWGQSYAHGVQRGDPIILGFVCWCLVQLRSPRRPLSRSPRGDHRPDDRAPPRLIESAFGFFILLQLHADQMNLNARKRSPPNAAGIP